MVLKKTDSMLRGNPGAEIKAAVHAFGCDVAVISPALPAMHRVVEGGFLRVTSQPEFKPVEVAALLCAQGAAPCSQVHPGAIAEAIVAGATFVSVDAACDADLDRIAAETLGLDRRVLWVGSAGLAAALARVWMTDAQRIATKPPRGDAVLLCVGSNHPATLVQMARLTAKRPVLLYDAEATTSECISEAMQRHEHVLLRFPPGRVLAARVCQLVSNAPVTALVLSGGDTASLVSRAVGARQIELRAEIVPGVPWGFLRGGRFDRLPVATKSGGFGDPDALIQIVDFFSCLNP
jgi:uncharacterized protein YgbK (DUF1537 family)